MTEEAKAEETVQSIAEKTEPEKTETKTEPDGTDFVEFPDPKLEARFRRIYGNMKSTERANEALREHLTQITKVAEENRAELAALKAGSSADQLKTEIVKAKERGDARAEVELTDRLGKLRQTPPPAPLPPPPMAEPLELHEARAWESEVGADGNFLRPWAQPQHPDFAKAMSVTKTLVGDPAFGGDVLKVLTEVDKRMGVKTTPAKRVPASVMSADMRPPRGDLPSLSADQVAIARKMGVDPKAYAQQLKLLGKGAAQ